MPGTPKSLLPLGFVLAAFALFAAYSLPHVYDPPIGTHGWRQAIATSEARMFASGTPFLYPRAEGCGDEPNVYMGSEFPLYAWTMGKLGGADGINFVGRVMGILSALLLMLSTFAIVRFLFRSWEEPYRSVAAAASATFFAVSPLFRFYGISFVPDLEAHALTLLGIAVFCGPEPAREEEHRPLSVARLLVGSLLICLGVMTKMIAVPHLALAGVVLLDRARAKEGLTGLRSLRPWLMAAVFGAIVLVPVWAWYFHWVPVLKLGGCELVWLPEKMDESWKTMTFTNPEWRFRMSKWGREDLLGPVWIACLAGLPLFLFAGFRGVLLLLWSIGCMLGYVRLGWHTLQHDYDFLLVLPAFAIGFGTSFGLLTRLLAIPGEKLKGLPPLVGKWAPFAALAVLVAVLSPGAHKQSRRHFYTGIDEVGLKNMVDTVLPEGEPIHYAGGKNDPRVPYFAQRRAWGLDPFWLYCQNKPERKYDCMLVKDTAGKLSPCNERRPAVAWNPVSLICGIGSPQDPVVPPRVLETIKKKVRFPADQAFPGVGRFLGAQPMVCGGIDMPCAGNMEQKQLVNLYFLPEVDAPPVELLADGKPIPMLPPPSKWMAGTVMVPQAELPSPDAKLELRVQGQSVPVASK
ncbi:MAG: hypothetical protein QM765_50885 [Myxococcales bacterium]